MKRALHVACEVGSELVVEVLLEAGADVLLETKSGVQPIHIAANNLNGKKCLQLLLDNINISPNVFDDNYYTPLHYATSIGALDNIKLLVDYYADINLKGFLFLFLFLFLFIFFFSGKGDYGIPPVYLAISEGFPEIMKYYIEKGCDIDTPDSNGNTALHIAASVGVKIKFIFN